ncbi:MAG: hypothetical protein DRN29_07870, partial [Thermoplasmata archaeon]
VGIHNFGNSTEIRENAFSDGEYGIRVENALDTSIHQCTFSDTSIAILLQNSNNINISHSIFNGDNDKGIQSIFAKDIEIFNCSFGMNEKGIEIKNSTAKMHTCSIYDNSYGAFITNSSFSITNSSFSDNICAIFGEGSNLFVNYTNIEKSQKGIEIFSSQIFITNATIKNTTYGMEIENSSMGKCLFSQFRWNEYGIYFLNASFISIINSSFYDNTYGMYGENCKNITSENTTFLFNIKGIVMKNSNLCSFITQIISNNTYGMEFTWCEQFSLKENRIEENEFGMKFSQSPNNTLLSNQLNNNKYNFDMEGLSTTDFYENIDTSNTINGEPMYYMINEDNILIKEPAGYIGIINCTDVILENISISNNGEGLLVIESKGISVKNCTFYDNIEGSIIFSSTDLEFNNTGVNNNFNDGILFHSSYDVLIFNCEIYKNGQRGINIYSLDEVDGDFFISGNDINENWLGLNIENTAGSGIYDNIIENNEKGGLRLFKANHTEIGNNTFHANGYGIDIRKSFDNNIFHNSLFGNGKGIYSENSESFINNCSFEECDVGVLSDFSTMTIKDCYFYNNSKGISNANSSSQISSSSFMNNTIGGEFIYTSFMLANSTINGNMYGIFSYYCTEGEIMNCSGSGLYNNEYAIFLNHSQNVSISLCDIFNNTIGLYLINSLNNSIYKDKIFNNTFGMVIINSTINEISGCLIHHNSYGTKIEGNENVFFNNSFWKNEYGVWIEKGINNTIYHNNFAYNNKNAYDDSSNIWDNGYPSGGNYWSDYAGRDEFNGPNQNISGSDGKGDTPYKIGGKSKDRYPLMEMYEEAAPIPNSPPVPSFIYYPKKPFSHEYVIFTDTSTDPNGKEDITAWQWDFGDGNTSNKQNPKHAYAHSGIYTVILTITDSYGESENITVDIEVKNLPPLANFSWNPSSPTSKEAVQFTDTSSDVDGSIVNYTWDFGDGSYSEEKNPSHTYYDNGVYIVTLTVMDNNGAKSVKTQEIFVENIPPTAEFFFIPEKASVGEEVNFTDVSSDEDGKIVSWHWEFGDGKASNEQHPVHFYEKGGKYTITLTIKDDDGAEVKITKTIEIEAKSTPGFELIILLVAIFLIFTKRKITFKK